MTSAGGSDISSAAKKRQKGSRDNCNARPRCQVITIVGGQQKNLGRVALVGSRATATAPRVTVIRIGGKGYRRIPTGVRPRWGKVSCSILPHLQCVVAATVSSRYPSIDLAQRSCSTKRFTPPCCISTIVSHNRTVCLGRRPICSTRRHCDNNAYIT